MKAYIVEVRKTAKGPQIVVSRTHPGLVKRLFELEVPELVDGVVEIKAVAREPGHRTKLAVASNDQNVDPVGACVGARGMRVRQVVNELRGEKVDIVPYSDDPPEFVMRALAPAKVREVRIHEDTGIAEVIVPDFQLSLAIGKEGQNARLAARPHRLARRHQERDAARRRRGGRRLRRRRVGRRPRRRAHVAAGRRRRRDQRGRRRLRRCRRAPTARGRRRAGDDAESDDAVIDVDDTIDTTPSAEEAAMHIEETVADTRGRRARVRRRPRAEDADVRAEEEAEIEETPPPRETRAERARSAPASAAGAGRSRPRAGPDRGRARRERVQIGRTAPGRGAWVCSTGVLRGRRSTRGVARAGPCAERSRAPRREALRARLDSSNS